MLFRFIMFVVFLALILWVIKPLIVEFFSTPGTLWDRLLATGDGSMTILHGRVTVLIGAVVGAVTTLGDMLGMSDIRNWLQSMMGPDSFSTLMAVVGALTVLARMRTLDR